MSWTPIQRSGSGGNGSAEWLDGLRGHRGESAYDLSRRLDQRVPRLGEHKAPAEPMKQRRAEVALQNADRLRKRRLGDVQGVRSLVHSVVVDHSKEVFELPGVHNHLRQ